MKIYWCDYFQDYFFKYPSRMLQVYERDGNYATHLFKPDLEIICEVSSEQN